MQLQNKHVIIVSDGTGITAETFSHSVLSQFTNHFSFTQTREPFINTVAKAHEVAGRINALAAESGSKPIIFSTVVHEDIVEIIKSTDCIFMDIFGACVKQLERDLQCKSDPAIGRSRIDAGSAAYRTRIEAINFSLAHDDGQFVRDLDQAEVIFVGVSRCGKTPTSLYLAMQYGVRAANFPLIPEDFERGQLPSALSPYRNKLFGLSIQPERLYEVRQERRPNSQYASMEQCRYEVMEAERLMRIEQIEWLSTTSKSIEEIATTVLQLLKLNRSSY